MKETKTGKVTHLNNPYTSEYNLQQDLLRKRRTYLKRRLAFIMVVGLILLAIPGLPLVKNYFQVQDYKAQEAQAQEDLETLQAHQEDLAYYVDLLSDEEYLAKLARSEYYLGEDEDIIFNLPEDYIPDHQRVIDDFQEKEEARQEDQQKADPEPEDS
ncbi:Septum formation initiator [Alloiococcus otitis]|uniref:Septum formation initiator n=1 Tax=Alloiococcus otitis ATCC 51267 TaxID=883081 RepID=K9EAQ2_9LACT|nr:septum formation initiator family protein [Alloiococcus otitis]EKU92881.1 hypothetical protein HMPREF9698_01588 [Alloiococcus otitis ATCC 51267]SUU80498.1 Septum formation initiator [Alloiococcus otitis]